MIYTYKAILSGPRYSSMKESRNNRMFLDSPIIEHNFPENMIVNIKDLSSFRKVTIGNDFWAHRNVITISMEDYTNFIENKRFYQVNEQNKFRFTRNFGCVLIRNIDGNDILTFIGTKEEYAEYKNKIFLIPSYKINANNFYDEYIASTGTIPKRNIKCYTDISEFNQYINSNKEERKKKIEEEKKNSEEITKTCPYFSFKTPKFKIVKIVKKTEHLKGAKEGDIIYGEIPVIKDYKYSDTTYKCGAMKGIGTLTNWITLYVNDEKVNTISPVVFPNLFFNNIIVEEVK